MQFWKHSFQVCNGRIFDPPPKYLLFVYYKHVYNENKITVGKVILYFRFLNEIKMLPNLFDFVFIFICNKKMGTVFFKALKTFFSGFFAGASKISEKIRKNNINKLKVYWVYINGVMVGMGASLPFPPPPSSKKRSETQC